MPHQTSRKCHLWHNLQMSTIWCKLHFRHLNQVWLPEIAKANTYSLTILQCQHQQSNSNAFSKLPGNWQIRQINLIFSGMFSSIYSHSSKYWKTSLHHSWTSWCLYLLKTNCPRHLTWPSFSYEACFWLINTFFQPKDNKTDKTSINQELVMMKKTMFYQKLLPYRLLEDLLPQAIILTSPPQGKKRKISKLNS